MNTYLLLFLLSLGLSLGLTPLVRRACERLGWLDEPRDGRRVHKRAVPRLGGVAIYATVVIALASLWLINNNLTRTIRADQMRLLAILAPATLVFLFGVYDDVRGANPRLKFLVQGVAGAALYLLGMRIDALVLPFAGRIELPSILGLAVTIFWTVAISNAFNLIDGMDGLAAGSALFAALVMLVVSLILGHPLITICALVLSGSLIGFLRYNFNPASIFMGDSGSLFIGFLLAALSLRGTQKASTVVAVTIPIIAFGLPVMDTGVAIVRRFISGRPLFQGDREHIHHMLLARGWSQRRVALVLYAASAVLGLYSLLFLIDSGRTTGLGLIVIGAAVMIAVSKLNYHEMDEMRAGVRRNWSERRQRVANNIRIRRASRALTEARTLKDLFGGVRHMLDLSEFVYANVQLDCRRNLLAARGELAAVAGTAAQGECQLVDGRLRWAWERGDIEAADIFNGGRFFWSLRLPLTTAQGEWGYINLYREINDEELLLDINYLSRLFQREMASAVQRIMTAPQAEGVPALELAAPMLTKSARATSSSAA
jgi:UDP-GlcNAc:undecaprenyl-phosphate/decaprenyl-phosphate GlcNAc-1-phosphate transferase